MTRWRIVSTRTGTRPRRRSESASIRRHGACDARITSGIDGVGTATMPLPLGGYASCRPMRPAFTIVEMLVAIVVFTIGLVALAATSGLVAAHVGDGGRLTAAAHAARTVLDSLGASGCDAIVGGSAARDGVALQWVVSRDSSAAQVELTVGAALRRGSRRDVYSLVVPCVRE